MSTELQLQDQQFDIVIIQCCQNCDSHQYLSRHSQWKYFQQFNQLKRKIQRFVSNSIVIKNPIPDQLTKTPQLKAQKNTYINKQTNQKVIFPRIGSFEIYIYNILIFSKLLSNGWPNHYKIIQILNKITTEKRKGNNIDHFSVFMNTQELVQPKQIKKSSKDSKINIGNIGNNTVKQKFQSLEVYKDSNISPRKKKQYRLYKSKDKDKQKQKTTSFSPLQLIKDKKNIDKIESFGTNSNKKQSKFRNLIRLSGQGFNNNSNQFPGGTRQLQSKIQKRVKLPALNNTISFDAQKDKNQSKRKSSQQSFKRIFNSIEEQGQSFIPIKKQSIQYNNLQDLTLNNESMSIIKQKSIQQQEELKFVENKSVQYSQIEKQFMNASIQYTDQQGRLCDFGIQIDDMTVPKENNHQFIQTILSGQKFFTQAGNYKKPYMLDQAIEVFIPIQKDNKNQQVQTKVTPIEDAYTNTQAGSFVNRGIQFPLPQEIKLPDQDQVIDQAFAHLYQKKRGILGADYYSVDRFQQKATKYKWTGRANINESSDILRKKIYLQSLVFSVYNFFGIKTPQKRISFQHCGNVVADKVKPPTFHVLTIQNPELHYPLQFQEFDYQSFKFPISELLTYKNSKQKVKFTNYGGFLALAYFLNDTQLYHKSRQHIGVAITNNQVKQIYKLSAQNFQLYSVEQKTPYYIGLTQGQQYKIPYERLSQEIQLQFISMLSKISSQRSQQQLTKFINQIFIHKSPSHYQYKKTIQSLKGSLTQQEFKKIVSESIVQEFIKMIKYRIQKIKQQFQGRLYSYNKYHSLKPTIVYSCKPQTIIDRKIQYKQKNVSYNDVIKHIRNKDHITVITGQSGLGKTTLLNQLMNKLHQQFPQINLIKIPQVGNDGNKYRSYIEQGKKNVIAIDNISRYPLQVIDFIKSNQTFIHDELSYCILTSDQNYPNQLITELKNFKIIHIVLQPMSKQQISQFLIKNIKNHSYSDKKNVSQDYTQINKYQKVLSNAFYCLQYCKVLSQSSKIDNFIHDSQTISRFSILKRSLFNTYETHRNQMKSMGVQFKDPIQSLKKIAIQYYHNNFSINQSISNTIKQFDSDDILKNQLAYYPLDLQSLSVNRYLFIHREYLNFYLVQAYSYFIQKSYRRMKMQKLFDDKPLMSMLNQRYKLQRAYGRLLQVIYNSRKFKNTYQQSSNAITLLCKMKFVFTNLNFDQIQIPQADLSDGIFYICSFRGANMQKVIMYRTQMIHCHVQNALMTNLDLLNRKYQLQFTALSASMSPDNKHIALGCGNYLIILNAQNGRQVKRIQAHLDVIRNVRYSKDGTTLVSIADDKTLRLWDTVHYRSMVFKIPQKGSITFNNQTDTIATISSKNVLKVWNIKSMAGQSYCQGHQQAITCVHFSRDGQYILTGSRDTTLRLWDLKGNQKAIYRGHKDQIIVGRISPNQKNIFSSSKLKDLIVWDLSSKSQLKNKKFLDQIHQILPDMKQNYIIINFYSQPNIVILNYSNLEIAHFIPAHDGRILSISFDFVFKKLISLGKDKTLRVWDFQKIIKVQTNNKELNIHKGPVLSIAYCKASKRYATGHQNGQINIWSVLQNQHLDQLWSHNGKVRCLNFDKIGKLYSGGSDGHIRIWNIGPSADNRSKLIKQPKDLQIHSQDVIKLKISNKNRIFASSSTSNELVVHDITGTNVIMSTRQQGRINAIDFSKDDKLMAIGGNQKFVVLYQVSQGGNSVTRLQQLGQHNDFIQAITFQGDSLLITALKNGDVIIWNHMKASIMKKIQNVSLIKGILAFQKKYICLASQDGKIRIIDMEQGKQVKTFKFSDVTIAMDASSQQNFLYTGTLSGNILIWNLNSIHLPPSKISFQRIAIDSQCSTLITVQSGKTLLKKDLFNHQQQIITLKLDSQIEGIAFVHDKIILLLKNGMFWQLGKSEYNFPANNDYQGDLFFMRDTKDLNLFKTPLKKLKGVRLPVQMVLQQYH